jgi:hypothetical protein
MFGNRVLELNDLVPCHRKGFLAHLQRAISIRPHKCLSVCPRKRLSQTWYDSRDV